MAQETTTTNSTPVKTKAITIDNTVGKITPSLLIHQAILQKLPAEHLEKLISFEERSNIILARKSFLTALSNFQNECPVLKKSQSVNFKTTKYNFTPIDEMVATIKPLMYKYGLSFFYKYEDVDSVYFTCRCVISHIDGHSESTTMTAGKDNSGYKNEIQSIGSTRSYLERYTLKAALGLVTADEDNDGQTSKVATSEPKQMLEFLTDKQVDFYIPRCKTLENIERLSAKLTVEQKELFKDKIAERTNELKLSND